MSSAPRGLVGSYVCSPRGNNVLETTLYDNNDNKSKPDGFVRQAFSAQATANPGKLPEKLAELRRAVQIREGRAIRRALWRRRRERAELGRAWSNSLKHRG